MSQTWGGIQWAEAKEDSGQAGKAKTTVWSKNVNETRTHRLVNKMSDHWAQKEKNCGQQLLTIQLDCTGKILQTIWALARTLMELRFPSDYVRPFLLMSLFIRLEFKKQQIHHHVVMLHWSNLRNCRSRLMSYSIFGYCLSAGISGSIIWHAASYCIITNTA